MLNEREPTLDELLSEPIVRKLMATDGITAADIRRLYRSLRDDRERLPAIIYNRALEAMRPEA